LCIGMMRKLVHAWIRRILNLEKDLVKDFLAK
jgi:hypothetical protein